MDQTSSNKSQFDTRILRTQNPLDMMSPAERYSYEQDQLLNPPMDSNIKAMTDTLGPFFTGLTSSWAGKTAFYLERQFNQLTSDDEAYLTPLNFNQKKIKQYDPLNLTADTRGLEAFAPYREDGLNNLEGITNDLNSVSTEHWPWLISSRNYGEFQDKLDQIRVATPEFASKGSASGKISGFLADTSAIITMSMALEPLAFLGQGRAISTAGGRIALRSSAERWGSMVRVSEEAAQAAETVSRLMGMRKYAALGVAEEIVIKAARNAVDPTYDPDASSLVFDGVLAAGIGGGIGAFAARAYYSNAVESYASRYLHQIRAGNRVIHYRSPLAFVTAAAADRTLLGETVAPVGESIDNIADDAYEAFSRTGRENVPGTESIGLPILQGENVANRADEVGASMLAGDVRPANFGEVMYTPANESLIRQILGGNRGGWRGVMAAAARRLRPRGELARSIRRGAGIPEELRPSGVILTNRRGARELAAGLGDDVAIDRNLYPGGQGRGTGIEIEFDSQNLRGDFVQSERLFAAAEQGDAAFQYRGQWRQLRENIRSISIRADADPTEVGRVQEMLQGRGWSRRTLADGTTVYTPPRRTGYAAAVQRNINAVNGIRSAILTIAAEISRRGGTVDQEMTRTIARALFAGHAAGLRGAALESSVYRTVERFLDDDVVQRIQDVRRSGNAVSIGTLDQSFDDLVQRSNTIDGLWSQFDTGLDEAGEALPGLGTSAVYGLDDPDGVSLILQVANEIRNRGTVVTRDMFEEIIEDLRAIMQDPPMRVNSRGQRVLDSRARLAQVAGVINSRVGNQGRRIYVPRALGTTVRNTGQRLAALRAAARAREQARVNAGAPAVPGTRVTAAQPVPPAGGGGGGGAAGTGGAAGSAVVPPNAPPGGTSIDGARRMQEEVPIARGSDTFGPIQRFFNQAAVVLRLRNPAARMAVWEAFNARRALATESGVNVAQGRTVFEEGSYEMTGHLATGLLAWRNGYTRYALNRGSGDRITLMDSLRTAFNRNKRQMMEEFDNAVVQQLRSGAFNHPSEAVNQTARSLRQIFNDIHTAANGAGVRGFQTSAVSNYFPRLWRWDRISRLGTTVEGRQALEDLLFAALGGATGTRQIVTETGAVVNLTDVREAARVLTNRLINLSNDSDAAPMLDIDDEIARAIENLQGPVSPGGTSPTPFGRARIMMDEGASMATAQDFLNIGRNNLSLADLTVTDIPTILKKYSVSVYGAINERRFIDSFNEQLAHYGILDVNGNPVQIDSIEAMIGTINRIGNLDATMGGSMNEEATAAFREIVSALRYEPLHRSNRELAGFERWGSATLGTMLPLGYLSTGGMFGLVAAGETSRIIGTVGMRSMLRQMPILSEMVGNWNNMDEGARNFAGMVEHWFHPSTDRLRRALMQDISNQAGDETNPFIRGLNSMANFFSDITLLAPVTSFTQNLMAASTIQHLYDVSRNAANRFDDATIRTLGLEPAQYDEIVQFVGSNAVTRNGLAGERIVDLRNINDVRMDNLRAFVDRAVRTRIQDMPTRGDFHRIGFTWYGRLLTQFRGFNLKGVDNFLFQNITRAKRGGNAGRLRVAQEITATMLFAGLIQYARQIGDAASARATGDDEKARDIEERMLTTAGFVRGAFTGPSEFFLPIMAVDAAWAAAVDDDPLFSAYRYSGLNWYGFPAQSFISKTWDITKDVAGATVQRAIGNEDKERDITQSTVHKFRLLLPFQNFPVMKHFLNATEAEIAEEFNLLEKQTRKRKSIFDN